MYIMRYFQLGFLGAVAPKRCWGKVGARGRKHPRFRVEAVFLTLKKLPPPQIQGDGETPPKNTLSDVRLEAGKPSRVLHADQGVLFNLADPLLGQVADITDFLERH